jgi:hypothetical protein
MRLTNILLIIKKRLKFLLELPIIILSRRILRFSYEFVTQGGVQMKIQPVKVPPTTAQTSELMEPKFGPQADALKRSPEEISEQAGQAQQKNTSQAAPGTLKVNIKA